MKSLRKQLGFWEAIAPALISGGASLLGGLMRNESSARQADSANEFSERMSSTAHQREVADLRAAGLNPILSASRGAPAPLGQQARVEDVLSPAVHSGLDAARTRSNVVLQQELAKTESEKQKLIAAQARALQTPGTLGDVVDKGAKGAKGLYDHFFPATPTPLRDRPNVPFRPLPPIMQDAIDAYKKLRELGGNAAKWFSDRISGDKPKTPSNEDHTWDSRNWSPGRRGNSGSW